MPTEGQTQDVMIKFRSTQKKKNSKGGDWLGLYLDTEQATILRDMLHAFITNPQGVNIQIHTTEKTSNTGHRFQSSICFVRPTQERVGAVPAGAPAQQWAPVRARTAQTDTTRQAVAAAVGGYPPTALPQAPRAVPRPTYPGNQFQAVAAPAMTGQAPAAFAPDPEEVPF